MHSQNSRYSRASSGRTRMSASQRRNCEMLHGPRVWPCEPPARLVGSGDGQTRSSVLHKMYTRERPPDLPPKHGMLVRYNLRLTPATAVPIRAKPAWVTHQEVVRGRHSKHTERQHELQPTPHNMKDRAQDDASHSCRTQHPVACTSAWSRAPRGRSSATPCATRPRSRARRPAWPPLRAPEAAAAALAAAAAPSPRRPCGPMVDMLPQVKAHQPQVRQYQRWYACLPPLIL
jgi:hypothetical protein